MTIYQDKKHNPIGREWQDIKHKVDKTPGCKIIFCHGQEQKRKSKWHFSLCTTCLATVLPSCYWVNYLH